jgi:DNA-binding transcriptional LysR family regulator
MDRLEAMSLLVATVETGSLSGASRKLGVPLPTVSRKVAELEAHLGARLFIRSTRRLSLTEAGSAYLAAARRILEQVEEAERAASGEYETPRGELVVTAPLAFGRIHVLPVITDFLKAFLEIQVRLVLDDRNLHLIDQHIDVAVRVGALPDSALVATRVGAIRWVTCASPAFLAQHGVPATPADLADTPCIVFDATAAGAPWAFAGPGKGPTLAAVGDCRLTVNTAAAAVEAAAAGVGLTRVMSYQAARAVAAGDLQLVLTEFEPEPIPVSLVHAGQGLLPLKTRRFLEFAVPALRRALAP